MGQSRGDDAQIDSVGLRAVADVSQGWVSPPTDWLRFEPREARKCLVKARLDDALADRFAGRSSPAWR